MNNKFLNLIQNTNGKIFSVTFVKRTDHTIRTMNCRLGVVKDLKGTGPKYDALSKGLITVYDLQKEAYRNINLDCIISARIDGIEYHNEYLLDDIRHLIRLK